MPSFYVYKHAFFQRLLKNSSCLNWTHMKNWQVEGLAFLSRMERLHCSEPPAPQDFRFSFSEKFSMIHLLWIPGALNSMLRVTCFPSRSLLFLGRSLCALVLNTRALKTHLDAPPNTHIRLLYSDTCALSKSAEFYFIYSWSSPYSLKKKLVVLG